MLEGVLGVGVGILIGLALLKYTGYGDQLKKELGYVASGAVFLLLAAVLPTISAAIPALSTAIDWINVIFVVIAFLLVLVGAITAVITIMSKIK